MIRRVGRPGLVGMAARTAVVAGTATAVSGRVAHKQEQKYASQEEAQNAAAAEALAAQQAQQAAAATVATSAPAGGSDAVAQIQQLAALRDQGILTEEEFSAKKAQLLGI